MNDDRSMPGLGMGNPRHHHILKAGLEGAEMDWLRALDRGFTDPVIELTERPPTRPGMIHVESIAIERTDVARTLPKMPIPADSMRTLMHCLAPRGQLTVIVTTPDGISIVNRPAPAREPGSTL